MSVHPKVGKTPTEGSHLSRFWEGALRSREMCFHLLLEPTTQICAPPLPPGPAPSGPASHLNPPREWGFGASTGFWLGLGTSSGQVKFPGYSILRQQPLGGLASFPNWQVKTAPPGPGEPVTSASGGGNEVGGVEGLEPAWGVSGASKQEREIRQISLGPSL